MVIKNTNISPNEVNYLDLNITICAITGKSYDKRDDFNFKIMNYPNLSGNAPKKPSCYGVFISQLVRYANINLHTDSFKLDVMVMVDKLITQNYHRKKLGEIFIHLWVKFGHDILKRLY